MKAAHYRTNAQARLSRTVAGVGVSVIAGALLLTSTAFAATTGSTSSTSQQRLQTIIAKGDQEISRRLTTLDTLTGKINAATKLTASDKATLSSEVTSTISGLTSLKSRLDSETTLSAARSDVQSIYNEYRVYVLVAPKVNLIKVADDQQVVEGKLTTLAQKLQSRITADQKVGKDVSALQSQLNDMISKTSAAMAISPNIESTVITLEPADYNSNHSILTGDNNQLKTARSDDQAAYSDAKSIVAGLKALK